VQQVNPIFRIGHGLTLTIFPEFYLRLEKYLKAREEIGLTFPEVVASYAANQKRIQDLLSTAGATYLVAIQPDINAMQVKNIPPTNALLWSNPKDRPAIYAAFVSAIKTELSRAGVRYIDLNAETSLNQPKLYQDAVHLSAEGYREVAKLIMLP
jgi:lysophospholipase L1-like esterase